MQCVCMVIDVQDLNRVITKPYTENKDDTSGRPDEVIISNLLESRLTSLSPVFSLIKSQLFASCIQ